MDSFQTLPQMLRVVAGRFGDARALNHRQGSGWAHVSTELFVEQTRRLALGLVALGLKRGQSVGLLAEPSPWWLMVDMAIQVAGGVSVPLFPHGSETNLKFKIRDSAMRFVFTSDPESALCVRAYKRYFSKAIERGEGTGRSGAVSERELMRRGDELSVDDPAMFARLCEQVRTQDVATIIYTSGSTGLPKGVRLTQSNLLSQIHAAGVGFPLQTGNDVALSVLPLAHVFERMVVYFYLSRGVGVWFADNPKNVGSLIQEVRPTCMTVVPRLLEKVYAAMVSKVELSGAVGRPVGRWAMELAERMGGNGDGVGLRHGLASRLIYPKMRQALGGRLRTVICGGAALSPRLCQFFWNIGVPVFQGYGMTESSPVISCNTPGRNRVGTVGQPFKGVEVMIGDQGEILARGPNVMHGYHKDVESTKEILDPDGWLHTGDLGRLDSDGYLTVTGRLKEMYKTAGGKYVCPGPVEKALTRSPMIDRAYVVGEGRAFVSCLLFPDTERVRQLLGTPGPAELADADLLDLPELNREVQKLVSQVNATLEPWEQMRQYRLVCDEMTIEGGTVTPTQKWRRSAMAEQYRELIDGIYSETGVPTL